MIADPLHVGDSKSNALACGDPCGDGDHCIGVTFRWQNDTRYWYCDPQADDLFSEDGYRCSGDSSFRRAERAIEAIEKSEHAVERPECGAGQRGSRIYVDLQDGQ